VWLPHNSWPKSPVENVVKKLSPVGIHLERSTHEYIGPGWKIVAGIKSPTWCNRIADSTYVREDEAKAIFELFSTPWFSRTWVVQEVVLAKQVVVRHDTAVISWDDIGHACFAAKACDIKAIISTYDYLSDTEASHRVNFAEIHEGFFASIRSVVPIRI
jgi:hypothetical protein